MCSGSGSGYGRIRLHLFSCKPKRTRVRVLLRSSSLKKKQEEEKIGREMVLNNLKLYMENMCIFEENEKLKKQAFLLHQENLALMSEFQKKFGLNKIPRK